MKDDYFLQSSGKIGFFWEADALDEIGNLKYPKHMALNKVGHGMYNLIITHVLLLGSTKSQYYQYC